MADEIWPKCYTCLKLTADPIAIADNHGDSKLEQDADNRRRRSSYIGLVLTKHFWFELEDILDKYLCKDCWSCIERFHRFFVEVEEVHEEKLRLTVIDIKNEPGKGNGTEKQGFAHPKLSTIEMGLLSEDCAEEGDLNDDVLDTEHLQKDLKQVERSPGIKTVVTSKPTRSRKKAKLEERIAKDDEMISRYCNMHCDKCALMFPSFTALQTHATNIHKCRAYVFCCDRKFNKRTRLLEHVQRHVDPDRFQCELCKRSCVDTEGLKRHKLKMHTPVEERPFKCDRCPKAFISETILNSHINYHRAIESKEFRCQLCDKFSFGNSSLLKAHEKNQHASTFEYVCDTCAKGFNQRGLFLRHLQEHGPKAPEEKIQCPVCSRWLLKVSMNKHVLRHNSPSYRCDLCGKESPNVLAHKSHIRFAHSDARFSCNFCGKVFKRALTLKEHIASHSGEVLYTCPYCPKTFNSNANMHAHRKKMHHKEWLDTKMKRFSQQQRKADS